MTRNEFYNDITEWWQLKEFCFEYDLTTLDCVYHYEDFDNIIDDALQLAISREMWYTIKDMLNEVPTGYDYYYVDPDDAWNHYGLNNDADFMNYRDDVAMAMDELELWDDDEYDEEDDEEDVDPDDLIPVADEPIAFDDFMNTSLVALDMARTNKQMAVVATSEFLVVEATA